MEKGSIIIIGGGFAGLSAGIYARMNGYKTTVFEMHDKPGGLCTSWNRKGYTIDGCVHWLVGSSPRSAMQEIWKETGILQDRKFIDMDIYFFHEGADGRVLTFYSDIDRLEKHLLDISPVDVAAIHDFTNGIRMCLAFDLSGPFAPLWKRTAERISMVLTMVTRGKTMKRWMKTTLADFTGRLKDPLLKDAFSEMWIPEFSFLFMLFTFAWLHRKNAGYPIGGSLPLSLALEKRYLDLGGEIRYKSKAEKIVTENGKATGVVLSDGTFHHAARIISAADGHYTLFNMLEGKFNTPEINHQYEKWPVFHPLLMIGLGINRNFEEIPMTISGFSFPLQNPVVLGGKSIDRLPVHLYHHDPALAPEGKSVMTIVLESDFNYWKTLSADRKDYLAAKEEVARTVIGLLEQRFPGISGEIEMTDVATPVTLERYTNNWKGSFEGWLITPENASVFLKPLSQTLPGLQNFHMCGQWVEPGGGLPTGITSARRLIKAICREDKKKFTATKA